MMDAARAVARSWLTRAAALLALCLAALAGCDGLLTPAAPSYTALRVKVERAWLTTGDSATVVIEPLDAQGRVTGTLPASAVSVTTSDSTILVVRGGYVVAVGSGMVEVRAQAGDVTGSREVGVHPRTLSITATAVVNQAAQRVDGSIPLIAGRAGMLQVFVTADRANFFNLPGVRVRVFQGDDEVMVRDVQPAQPAAGVQWLPLEDGTSVSWNVPLPGELVGPGLGVLMELDPAGMLPHTEPDQPRLVPASGEPLRFAFADVAPFRIRFVPVLRPGMPLGDITPDNAEEYLEPTRLLYPLDEVEWSIREPFTAQTEGEDWVALVNEILMLRVADGSSDYYYGIARGHSGRAYLGTPVAISWDMNWPDAAATVAHELGHNFGRLHAGPCRLLDPYLDENYPHAGGGIGAYGFDPRSATLYADAEAFDIMGRCDVPYWVSDYTYEAVFEFRRREALWFAQRTAHTSATPERVPTLLVWGSINEHGIRLEPAFEIETVPSPPAGGGSYTLEGRDDEGAVLFSYSFEPAPLAKSSHDRGFAFAIPLTFPMDRLAALRVSGNGRSTEVRSAQPAGNRAPLSAAALPVAAERVEGRAQGEVEIRWEPGVHRAALVLDAATGAVLAVARDGRAHVHSEAADLELRLSDGLGSVTRRVTVQ